MQMVDKKSWEEFTKSGLLWWINRILHTFGWAICVELNPETGEVKSAYPARVKFRGFTNNIEVEGFKKISKYLKKEIESIEKETYL